MKHTNDSDVRDTQAVDATPPPRVLLFLSQGFEDLEAAAVIDVCGWTEYLPTVRVATTGFHEEVRGRFGTVVRPDLLLSMVNPEDYVALAIPGAFFSHGFAEAFDPAWYELVRKIHANGETITTMCVWVLPVAEAGLLRGKRATTYPFSRNHDNPGRLCELGYTPDRWPRRSLRSDRLLLRPELFARRCPSAAGERDRVGSRTGRAVLHEWDAAVGFTRSQ